MTIKIRYKFIEAQALDFFGIVGEICPEQLSFPLDIIGIISNFKNYKIQSYQAYASKLNKSVDQVASICNSNSGCTFYNKKDNAYVIAFNKNQPCGRQKWTLAHELGHCFLNHFNSVGIEQISENNIISLVDKTLEGEADYFASVILAPFPLFKTLDIQSPIDVQNVFGLSAQASLNKFKDYLVWKDKHYKNSFDADILKLFQLFCCENRA